MTEQAIQAALTRALGAVREPVSGRDLLTAGLIKELSIEGSRAIVVLELGSASPAHRATVEADVQAAATAVGGIEQAEVRFVTGEQPPASACRTGPRRLPMAGGQEPHAQRPGGGAPPAAHGQGIAQRQPIESVRHLIAVASGKGGVGKSTVCANLALALVHQGARVGLLDADIYGPSVPTMMGVNHRPQAGPDGRIAPVTSYGLKLMSLGFLLDDSQPVIWRGPMVQGVVRQFLREVTWGELDYLLIDLPPGTGDAQLTLVQSVALSGAIIVTTPSDLALIDAAKGLNMFRQVDVPVLGIVENMSYFICPHCDERTDVFSAHGGQRIADKLETPFLGEIPLWPSIRQGGDEGKPIVAADPDHPHAAPFFRLAEIVRERCEVRDDQAAAADEKRNGLFSSLFRR